MAKHSILMTVDPNYAERAKGLMQNGRFSKYPYDEEMGTWEINDVYGGGHTKMVIESIKNLFRDIKIASIYLTFMDEDYEPIDVKKL